MLSPASHALSAGSSPRSLLTNCMTKSKFYAVRKGLVPGIYRSWDACKQQTQGISGAVFQSFKTQEAAEHYLESGVGKSTLTTSTRRTPAKRKTSTSPSREKSTNAAAEPALAEHNAAEGHNSSERRTSTARSDTEALPSWMDPEVTYRLEFDGASRGNPGAAGAGAALFEDTSNKQVGTICLKLGHMTNNQAEYYGLLAGLEAARTVGVKHLKIFGDSQLVIRQVNGQYKVSNNALQGLYSRVKLVLEAFQDSQVKHVLREHNKVADELSNRAIDTAGWQGLKDLQGQLWGACQVESGAHQTTAMVGTETAVRPHKQARA